MNGSNLDALKSESEDLTGDQAIAARFADGSVIFGTAKVTLTNDLQTTAYDFGFAHEKQGIRLAV